MEVTAYFDKGLCTYIFRVFRQTPEELVVSVILMWGPTKSK